MRIILVIILSVYSIKYFHIVIFAFCHVMLSGLIRHVIILNFKNRIQDAGKRCKKFFLPHETLCLPGYAQTCGADM